MTKKDFADLQIQAYDDVNSYMAMELENSINDADYKQILLRLGKYIQHRVTILTTLQNSENGQPEFI